MCQCFSLLVHTEREGETVEYVCVCVCVCVCLCMCVCMCVCCVLAGAASLRSERGTELETEAA